MLESALSDELMKNSQSLKSFNSNPKESNLGYSLVLVVPSTVLVDRQETCAAVFSSAIPENVEYYIRFVSATKNSLVKATQLNSSALTFVTPENFPPGKYQISIHHGNYQTLLCKYDLPFMFHSKLESIRNLLELTNDPISVVANAFGLKETDYVSVDVMLEKNFKLNIPSNFNLLQNSSVNPNPGISSSLMPTLLHFAAKYNLINLSITLLKCPGAVESLMIKNFRGFTPMDIANANGHLKLAGVFSDFMNRIVLPHDISEQPQEDNHYELMNCGSQDEKSNRNSTSSNDSGYSLNLIGFSSPLQTNDEKKDISPKPVVSSAMIDDTKTSTELDFYEEPKVILKKDSQSKSIGGCNRSVPLNLQGFPLSSEINDDKKNWSPKQVVPSSMINETETGIEIYDVPNASLETLELYDVPNANFGLDKQNAASPRRILSEASQNSFGSPSPSKKNDDKKDLFSRSYVQSSKNETEFSHYDTPVTSKQQKRITTRRRSLPPVSINEDAVKRLTQMAEEPHPYSHGSPSPSKKNDDKKDPSSRSNVPSFEYDTESDLYDIPAVLKQIDKQKTGRRKSFPNVQINEDAVKKLNQMANEPPPLPPPRDQNPPPRDPNPPPHDPNSNKDIEDDYIIMIGADEFSSPLNLPKDDDKKAIDKNAANNYDVLQNNNFKVSNDYINYKGKAVVGRTQSFPVNISNDIRHLKSLPPPVPPPRQITSSNPPPPLPPPRKETKS